MQGAPFAGILPELDGRLAAAGAGPRGHPCLERAIRQPASRCHPKSIEQLRPREGPVEPAKGKRHNPVCRSSAVGRTISTLSQPRALPDSEAVRPGVGGALKAPRPPDSSRFGPFEKGSSKNYATRSLSVELISVRDWRYHAKGNQ